jgi:polyisoprenoid-binding protein YceI
MAGVSVWKIDPAHSAVEFSVKHMMMTTVRGRFREVAATIDINEENPDQSAVRVEIGAASIDTGNADRDKHLRSPDFFDVEQYPTIVFESKRIEGAHSKEGDEFKVVGDLTMRDTTIEVTLDAVFDGTGTDPWGKQRAGFTATGEVDRREWGLKWNQAIETGGVLVANKVKIQAEVQAVEETLEASEAATEQAPEERPSA